ncbi:MAG TPA: MmgE/PrpD family protein [Rhodopila sp.]|uniref:MmgE/PrpD family protein n=1 Tax=Rhodopila sp. TaxID=2480087 RepID=UPI002C69C1A0|nr:MmgE/PrpD family protein [Rhodopila sp.]HVY17795.1 MmgE/PrpD family protein [Rhodopila sp.]
MSDPTESELALARRISDAPPPISAATRATAVDHILDFAGVAVAGSISDPARLMAGLLQPSAAPSVGAAPLWGARSGWLPAREAALVNAIAGHFHDFDDDEPEYSLAHPTVTVLPAAVAASSLVATSGERLIDAYIAGVELVMRLGLLINPAHYKHGFHATATLGVLGAAVSAGRVLGLDAETMRHALGIAASLAGGLRSNFGSDAKCIQTGSAARNGLLAAQLALSGLTSTPGSLFGPLGFIEVFDGKGGFDSLAAQFGEPWLFVDPGITIKAYPCCTSTHTAVDGLLALLAERPIPVDAVERIDIDVDEATPRILIHDWAQTALEGKFSMPFCLAAGLVHRCLGIAQFDDAVVQDPVIRRLMGKVTMHPDVTLPKPKGGISLASRLRLTLIDGTVLERFTEQPSGSRAHRLTRQQLRTKFLACAAPVLGEVRAERAFETLSATAHSTDAAHGFALLCQDEAASARP